MTDMIKTGAGREARGAGHNSPSRFGKGSGDRSEARGAGHNSPSRFGKGSGDRSEARGKSRGFLGLIHPSSFILHPLSAPSFILHPLFLLLLAAPAFGARSHARTYVRHAARPHAAAAKQEAQNNTRVEAPPLTLTPGDQTTLYRFESTGAWSPAADNAEGGGSATITGAGASTHPLPGGAATQSLKVNLKLPSAAGIRVTPDENWKGISALEFSVYLPASAPPSLSLGAYVKDNEWWWYETFPLRHVNAAGNLTGPELIPGRWNHVLLDLRPEAAGWVPGGHDKPWSGALRPYLEFGLLFYAKASFQGAVEISPISGWKVAPIKSTAPVKAERVELSFEKVTSQWTPVTVTMQVNRRYQDPFDPDVVNVEGKFTGPDGAITIPGFIYQDYTLPAGKKNPVPRGPLVWKVRFMPTAAGRYTYIVTLTDKSGKATLTTGSFECKPAHNPGFVRISQKDPRYFAFDDRSFYYPIGLNVRHAGDMDNVHGGLPAIEHIFNKMASVGLNWTRTWMCSWWLAIEWSHEYDARYHGVGYYNLSNAWLLDKTLDTADRDGLYVELTLNNHGQFSTFSDSEWKDNPYNEANGGRLQTASQFFTDPWAKQMFKQRLRYIVARWSYDPHIFSWELFNEVDLTNAYHQLGPEVVSRWLTEMADYIHSIDPWQHLVSTHICGSGNLAKDPVIWSNPKMQYVQADAYCRFTHGADTMASITDKVWEAKRAFDKPAYIVEYGYKLTPTYNPQDPIVQFHPGIWAGFMSPLSADSMFWDWYVVDEQNFWPQYAAIVRFARGEDRRGQNLDVSDCRIDGAPVLDVDAISNDHLAYAWVFSNDMLGHNSEDGVTPTTGARFVLHGLKDGAYKVQFWDTFTGVVTGEITANSASGQLVAPLPAIKVDLALKIKRAA